MNDEQLGQLYHTARNAASFRDFKTVAVEILADGGKDSAALDDDVLCQLADKYALGNPRLDRLRGFVNHILIIAKADGGKGEAVAWFVNTAASGDKPHYEQVAEQFNGSEGTFQLYTAPQAECAPRSPYGAPFTTDVEQCCGDPSTCNDPCEPPNAQAECAPREALNLQAVFTELRVDFSVKDSGKALKAVERAIAAPTPERAQESAGVRLKLAIRELRRARNSAAMRLDVGSINEFDRVIAILTANKEPQP